MYRHTLKFDFTVCSSTVCLGRTLTPLSLSPPFYKSASSLLERIPGSKARVRKRQGVSEFWPGSTQIRKHPQKSIPRTVDAVAEVLLYVHRNRRLIRDGSPGHTPGLSNCSRAREQQKDKTRIHATEAVRRQPAQHLSCRRDAPDIKPATSETNFS